MTGFGSTPLVWVAPFLRRRVGVVVKESVRATASERFEASVRAKVEGLGSTIIDIVYIADDPDAVETALSRFVRGADPADLILTAGTASTDPRDACFVAIDALGGRVVRRGVPAHPGSMLWLARIGGTTILGLPTCGAYSKATAADLLLPRLLSGEPASERTVAKLGHGGILNRTSDSASRRTRASSTPRTGRAPAPWRARGSAPCRFPSMTDRDDRPAGTRSIEAIQDDFRGRDYITDRSLATAVFLALELGRPLLLEGEAGVGKTELAKVLAACLGTRLIRLQCYEGLDVNTAVYEWNYPRQMLEIRLLEARGEAEHATAHDIFGADFLIRRPLLQALESDDGVAPVLLIDEIDRADEEFEAYLLEILSDFQVTVPEIGTIRAETAAAGHPHLQPDARGPRRAQAPLPVPLDRLSDRAEGVRDRPRARSGRARATGARGRRLRPSPARGRPDQGAGHRRDPRLGGGAARRSARAS